MLPNDVLTKRTRADKETEEKRRGSVGKQIEKKPGASVTRKDGVKKGKGALSFSLSPSTKQIGKSKHAEHSARRDERAENRRRSRRVAATFPCREARKGFPPLLNYPADNYF